MPRPTKLTPQVQKRLVSAIRAGNSIEASAASAGIDERTFYNWMKQGQSEDGPDEIYIQFFQDIKKAQAYAEMKSLATVRKAGSGYQTKTVKTTTKQDGSVETVVTVGKEINWQAAAWYLERKYPERWGNTQKVRFEVEKELEKVLTALESKLSPDVYSQLLETLSTLDDTET